jgi:hypothetical protein
MAGAVTLVLLVAAGDATNATTRSMARATREALGPNLHLVVRPTNGEPTDSEALRFERSDGADAVVELAWADAKQRQATLRVHLARSGHWLQRSIGFQPSDAEAERGRTLGFAVASFLPEPAGSMAPETEPVPADRPGSSGGAWPPTTTPGATSAAPSSKPPSNAAPTTVAPESSRPDVTPSSPLPAGAPPMPPAVAAPLAPPAVAPALPPAVPPSLPPLTPTPLALGEPSSGATSPSTPPTPSAKAPGGMSAPDRTQPSFLLDLLAIGITPPWSFGAEVSGQWFAIRTAGWIAVRVGAGLSFGNIEVARPPTSTAPATFPSTTAIASAGLVAHVLRASARRRFGATLRADWWLVYERVADATGTLLKTTPFNDGPDLVADINWLVSQDVEATAGGGAQYALEPAEVSDDHQNVATFRGPSQWRAVFEAGLRIRF